MVDRVTEALKRHFGFDRFRPGQREVVDAILEGRPVVAVMPTGAGKSLCYQLPAMLLDGVTLVVSPLIALMKDQVDSLRARGIPAAYVNSTLSAAEQRQALGDAAAGRIKLLYLAPERFRFAGARAALKRLPLALFAVDEAHCISQWGHDFRPDYKQLGYAAADLQAPRVAAFTATATARVRQDIVDTLALQQPVVKVAGFLRDNLHLSVVPIRKMMEKPRYARRIVERCGGPAIVYCATRKNCEEAAAKLIQAGIEAVVYHGGLDDAQRRDAQDAFAQRDDLVIVATNAFGMGVDKPNVRAVIHWDLPGSVDAYYQEAGRAGRDGEPAWCVMLFTYADTRIHEFFIDKGGENLPYELRAAVAEMERSKLKAIVRYAYDEGCRHAAILRYFGDTVRTCDAEGRPGCDNCSGGVGLQGVAGEGGEVVKTERSRPTRVDPRPLSEAEEIIVQKVLSAVARANGRLSPRRLARVLRGSKARDVVNDPLAGSKSYGILESMREAALLELCYALERAECTVGRCPRLTSLGVEVMWRRAAIQLDIPPFEEGAGRRRRQVHAEATPLSVDQRDRYRALKQRRFEAAKERGVPAFVVASNRVLEQLATLRPDASRDDWLALRGVGDKSVDPLREVFLELVAGA